MAKGNYRCNVDISGELLERVNAKAAATFQRPSTVFDTAVKRALNAATSAAIMDAVAQPQSQGVAATIVRIADDYADDDSAFGKTVRRIAADYNPGRVVCAQCADTNVRKEATIASMVRFLRTLNLDEVEVVDQVLMRVVKGRNEHGPLDLATDARNWDEEAGEEVLDLMAYRAMRAINQRRAKLAAIEKTHG